MQYKKSLYNDQLSCSHVLCTKQTKIETNGNVVSAVGSGVKPSRSLDNQRNTDDCNGTTKDTANNANETVTNDATEINSDLRADPQTCGELMRFALNTISLFLFVSPTC